MHLVLLFQKRPIAARKFTAHACGKPACARGSCVIYAGVLKSYNKRRLQNFPSANRPLRSIFRNSPTNQAIRHKHQRTNKLDTIFLIRYKTYSYGIEDTI